MFAAVCIALSVALLAGIRHEPALRAWAMSPRTPGRVAHNLVHGSIAVASAVSFAAVMVLAGLAAVDQAAGII
jgi:hypothetical protein